LGSPLSIAAAESPLEFATGGAGMSLRTGDALAKASPTAAVAGEFVCPSASFERGRIIDFRVCIGQDRSSLGIPASDCEMICKRPAPDWSGPWAECRGAEF